MSIFRDLFEDRYLAITRCNLKEPADGGGCHLEIYDMPWVECIASKMVPGFFKGRDLELDAPDHGMEPSEQDAEEVAPEMADLALEGAGAYVEYSKAEAAKKNKKKAPKKAKKLEKAAKAVEAGQKVKEKVDALRSLNGM